MTDLLKDLFSKIPDKPDYYKTTSHKFKADVVSYFSKIGKNFNCVELGTHSGKSAYMLSNLFKEVYTFELSDDQIREAKLFNKERDNIRFHQADIYLTPWYEEVSEADVFFVDAVHLTKEVITDVGNCLKVPSKGTKIFIFDDYGLRHEVKTAVDQLVSSSALYVDKFIGHPSGWEYGPNRKLTDWEGVICKSNL